jgi:L-lysine exporter family protein LysE/ArgO
VTLAPELAVFGRGFAVAAGLVVAIGAQNAFVLRQGLRREHVFAVALACSLFDLGLEAAGIGGLGALVREGRGLRLALGLGGTAFLAVYGALAWKRAWHESGMPAAQSGPPISLGRALAQCVAFTFLNPHVYLDTVVLIGSVGAQQPAGMAGHFLAGAAIASACWFFSLAYGARALAPVLARPGAWRVLDFIIGATMFALAALIGHDTLSGI